jgi:hypothetical protein
VAQNSFCALSFGRDPLPICGMAKSLRAKKAPASETPHVAPQLDALPSIPASSVFSFLKDTRGALTWTARDLAASLQLSEQDANKILTLLQLQGYVQQKADSQEWLTTASGEIVSNSKLPRLSRESVEEALNTLMDRIAAINRDPRAEYQITKAVAFGDFLSDGPKVQAADVGIELRRRNPASEGDQADKLAFLKQLAREKRFLHIQPYEKWMSDRSHRGLLPPR